jgi:hypothetical protein
LQQFFRLRISIVERVDEVETDIARDQLELQRLAARVFSGFGRLGQRELSFNSNRFQPLFNTESTTASF